MDGRWGPGGLRFRCFFFSEISQKFGMFFGRLVRMPKYWYNFATFPKLVFIQSVSSTGVKQYILPSMIRPKGETIWRRASRSTFCDWTSPQPPTISHLQLQENENYDRLLQSTAAISSCRGPSSNCFFGGGVAKTRMVLDIITRLCQALIFCQGHWLVQVSAQQAEEMGHALEVLQKCFVVGWCWLMVAAYTYIVACWFVVMILSCCLGDPIPIVCVSVRVFSFVRFVPVWPVFGGKKVVELVPTTYPSCGMPQMLNIYGFHVLLPTRPSHFEVAIKQFVELQHDSTCIAACRVFFKASIQSIWSEDRFFP